MQQRSSRQFYIWIILQWTWGFFQTLLGFIFSLGYLHHESFEYRGAKVIMWHKSASVSLGRYIFLNVKYHPLLVHEYGHCIQSLMLGPLYLPLIGLPSFIWCNIKALRKNKNYYTFYTEASANALAYKFTKEKPIQE